MKVVIANINELKGLDISFVIKMLRVCNDLGISPPIYVRTAKSLLQILEESENEKILLFSNFPPDSSYPKDEDISSGFVNYDFIRSAALESFSKSIFLLAKIGVSKRLAAIHIITCALPEVISDEFLRSLLPGSPTMIKRTDENIITDTYFELIYSKYIIEKVKEALSQTNH